MLLKYMKRCRSRAHFLITQVPLKFLTSIKCRTPIIDYSNCAVINKRIHKAFYNESEYVKIRTTGLGKGRLVRVLGDDVENSRFFVSNLLNYNLNQMAINGNVNVNPVDLSNIKIATEVDVSWIVTQLNVGKSVSDVLLKNYFKTPKLLYKNDVIAINLSKYGPQFHYTNIRYNETENLYFKCNKITYENIDDCAEGYFCVNGGTTLKQSADIQSDIPTKLHFTEEENESEAVGELLTICPAGLTKHLEKIEKAIKPFTTRSKLKLNPSFLVKGAKGSGKNVLVQSLGAKLGLKLCKLTTSELSSQAYAQTEIKIKNAFIRAKLCAPCIVVINNFENLCKNNEGQYDSRIISTFKGELIGLFSDNDYCTILICISNTKDMPSELSRIFLETFTIDAPNQNERAEMLEWILRKNKVMGCDVIDNYAGKTHGFLFEDLEALVFYALRHGKSGQSLNESDFEYGLDVMQANYTESLGAPKVPKVEWSDVGGLDDVKHEIIKTINLPLKHPELLKTGLKRSGILLYGPPGTGKTLMAKAVATECGLCFLSVKGPELLNMYVGQSEQNVREVFEKARQASPCIIFFDELDSLAPNRGISGDSGGVMDRVVSQLLAEMDGLNQNATLFVIGATNRPDLIDPALLRPGRFDKLLYVGPCTDFDSKLSVLKALTRKFKLSEKLSLEKVVKTCPQNITGADFYGICSNAWMAAASRLIRKIEKGKIDQSDNITQDNVIVAFKDFEEAIKQTKPSVSGEDLKYFDKLKMELSGKK